MMNKHTKDVQQYNNNIIVKSGNDSYSDIIKFLEFLEKPVDWNSLPETWEHNHITSNFLIG